VLALTRGRYSAVGWLTGLPLITVTMQGAKSGQPRSLPLLGIPVDEKIVVIGSNWGRAQHPAWAYNLRAHPEVTVTLDHVSALFVARETDGEEREQCWRAAAKIYPGYDLYKQRAKDRKISVWVLTPQT
jgi:deazaflavin-dependent oxidoreductase (nitroreductase family)